MRWCSPMRVNILACLLLLVGLCGLAVASGIVCDGVDDSLDAGNVLDLPNATFTIDWWLTTTGTASFQYVLSKGAGTGGYFVRLLSTGVLSVEIRNAAAEAIASRTSVADLNDGVRRHVAVVLTTDTTTRDNNLITIYVNGVTSQNALVHTGTGAYAGNTGTLRLCRLGSNYLAATLENVRVWSGNLDAATIALLAQSRSVRLALPTPLLAQWTFLPCPTGASCQGVAVRDVSGNGLTMTPDDGANNTGVLGIGTGYLSATGGSR